MAVTPKGVSSCGQTDPTAPMRATYNSVISQQSPINVDLPQLKQLAATCAFNNSPGDVVEISHQNLSALAMLAGGPKSMTVFGYAGNEQRTNQIRLMATPYGTVYNHNDSLPNGDGIPQCDLLFLDIDPHTEKVYFDLLKVCAPQCRRYIALHDSVIYGEQYNGEPGLMPAVNRFIATSNGEWHIVKHYKEQNGLLVLSRHPKDTERPDAPDEEIALAKVAKPVVTQQAPDFGPGTELRVIFKSIGVEEKPGCDCSGKMMIMNTWGVAGCRSHLNEIIGWMEDGMERWGWIERMKALAMAAYTGLAFKINPARPWHSIINLAIDRAEEKEKVPA